MGLFDALFDIAGALFGGGQKSGEHKSECSRCGDSGRDNDGNTCYCSRNYGDTVGGADMSDVGGDR